MKPRKSKKNKALALHLQKQASLFASTAHLFMGEMYNMHRSQRLQLVALEFRLHLPTGCPAEGLGSDMLWHSYLFQSAVQSEQPVSLLSCSQGQPVWGTQQIWSWPVSTMRPWPFGVSFVWDGFPVWDACAEGFEHSLGCGLTRSTGSAGAHASSVEAKCSLCIRFQLPTAFREAHLVPRGRAPDLRCAWSFISSLSGSLSEIETNRPRGVRGVTVSPGRYPHWSFGQYTERQLCQKNFCSAILCFLQG